jgi:glycosyltransferase involved in cell wall biosynthesis
MEKAIVSHSIGAEGIDAEVGREIAIADDPESFADSVADLIGDRTRCLEMGRAARAKVCEKYAWREIVGSLTALYESAVRNGHGKVNGTGA